MGEKKRIEYIDSLKFFAIFLVILGHVVQYGIHYKNRDGYLDNPVWSFIYSFHMPLFIFISGFFASHALKYDILSLIKGKAINILLPSFVWICTMEFLHKRLPTDITLFYNNYWYLNTLFVCILITYIIQKYYFKYRYVLYLLTYLLLCLTWGGYYVSYLFPFYIFGDIFNRKMGLLFRRKNLFLFSSLFMSIILYIVGKWNGHYTFYESNNVLFYGSSLNTVGILIMLYRLFLSMSIVLFIFTLFSIVGNKVSRLSLVRNIGKETLGIYLISVYLCKHLPLPDTDNYLIIYIVAIIGSTSILFFSYGAVLLFKKNRYTAMLYMGKNV